MCCLKDTLNTCRCSLCLNQVVLVINGRLCWRVACSGFAIVNGFIFAAVLTHVHPNTILRDKLHDMELAVSRRHMPEELKDRVIRQLEYKIR